MRIKIKINKLTLKELITAKLLKRLKSKLIYKDILVIYKNNYLQYSF